MITPCRILLLAAAIVPTNAFHVKPVHPMRIQSTTRLSAVSQGGSFQSGIDIDRAKACADNFGECSVEEIRDIKKSKKLLDHERS
jgi:hypothetical protein